MSSNSCNKWVMEVSRYFMWCTSRPISMVSQC